MTTRNRWTFEYTAGEILAAIGVKVEHHNTKVEWWTQERVNAAARFDESVEVDDGHVDIDKVEQQNINTCDSKIQSHQHRAWNYERWARAFSTTKPDQPFALDVDDVAYFGL